jgi:hypothetical protein
MLYTYCTVEQKSVTGIELPSFTSSSPTLTE